MTRLEAKSILERLNNMGGRLGYANITMTAHFFDGLKRMLEILPVDSESFGGSAIQDCLNILNALEVLGNLESTGLKDNPIPRPLSIVRYVGDLKYMPSCLKDYKGPILFLGEMPQMEGHCAIVLDEHIVFSLLHTDSFVEKIEEEL